MSEIGLLQIIEGALLAAGKPMTVVQLAELFEEHERPENAAIRDAMKEVAQRCDDRGFELVEVASGFRYQVRQSLSPWVARLWHERPARYSRALLETLALIAYRQPITRGEIEEIRGVAVSSNIIKTLHEREWIRVVGHRDVPGRPAMYATTRQFLDYFNLKNLDQLPALAEIRDLDTLNAELGFSDPLPADTNTEGDSSDGESEAPELTVVGGTDHVVEPNGQEQDEVIVEGQTETELESDSVTEAGSIRSSDTETAADAEAVDEPGTDADEIEPENIQELTEALDELSVHTQENDSGETVESPDTLAEAESDEIEAVKPESQF
ncbi:MAG: SMC-Scp complex subunit ScpB [Halioglobus sp.]